MTSQEYKSIDNKSTENLYYLSYTEYLENYCKNWGKESLKNSYLIPEHIWDEFGAKATFIFVNAINNICYISKEDWVYLEKKGLASSFILKDQEIVKILSQKSPQKITKISDGKIKICIWCKSETYILHEHHFPIKKKDKGKDTVNICPNCHCEFHFLSENKQFKLNETYTKPYFEALKERDEFLERIS